MPDLRWPGLRWPGLRCLGVVTAGAILGTLALLVLVPLFLPVRVYFVRSGSMAPTMPTGSLVVLDHTGAEELRAGDIITFHRPDRPAELVTHRILSITTNRGQRAFVTKGDANPVADPWLVPAAGTGWRYAFHLPEIGYLVGAFQTVWLRSLIVGIDACVLAFLALRRIWFPKNQDVAETSGAAASPYRP